MVGKLYCKGMKIYIRPVLIFLAGAVSASLLTFIWMKSTELEVNEFHYENPIERMTEITCSYPRVLGVHYINNEIGHVLPQKETVPIVQTFTDFEGEFGRLKYFDATQTITEVSVLKIIDNPDLVVFVNTNSSSYTETMTIFKQKGVGIYTKGQDLLGIPSGSLSMGTCTGY